ncbi:hypothetical protein [Amycolatopsis viridis]|uniref:Uncharacterized protein n=1 Tax=Amycolatopsis viridis TaxID=185678 RepID=A0ABX0STZ2_9PSEU|nr:hypothetical protein [Amycolatopsis viridis]NIH80115.1 hypothetical protein [Amycolatopsis viridis]
MQNPRTKGISGTAFAAVFAGAVLTPLFTLDAGRARHPVGRGHGERLGHPG